jgi:hypothetical protein
MSAQLQEIVVQDYAATKFARVVPDQGIEFSGSLTDVTEHSAACMGLGPEAAAEDFKQAV